jgi:hypothetical protein
MKIRTGYVSNSSSSSFIVAFAEVPKTVEEMRKMLFGNTQTYAHPYQEGHGYPTVQVAETVFKDLKAHKPILPDGVGEEVSGGYFEGYPKIDLWEFHQDMTENERRTMYEEERRIIREAAEAFAANFIKENVGKKFFVFSYSDNESSYESALEHGDLFRNMPHLRISHH